MRRAWIVVGLVVATIAAAGGALYYKKHHRKNYDYPGTRLMADLSHADALIRTSSLSKLPHDLLKIPIARDVLTEDLVFYYEQNEDRLGLNGAIKRIAYEHQLGWSDRLLATIMDEPAEVGLWRDGKGALRHYAVVIHRSTLTKVLQEVANVALSDKQLKVAGEISTAGGKAKVMALEINSRRTLLLIAKNDHIVLLSDPGLLFDSDNKVVSESETAIASWLDHDDVLSQQFSLETSQPKNAHTLVIGAPTLSLGYAKFLPSFKGLRFDYDNSWSTSVWLDRKALLSSGYGDNALWHAAPANPSACVVLPVDWQAAQQVIAKSDNKPQLNESVLKALDGTAMACWYSESTLYSPVFIAKLAHGLPDREAAMQALASWAIARKGSVAPAKNKGKSDAIVWRGEAPPTKAAGKDKGDDAEQKPGLFAHPSVATSGDYVVFSPDGVLVDTVVSTIGRANPSVADQIPTSDTTMALITPRRLSKMVEKEAFAALEENGGGSLLTVAQAQLPPHMKALEAYPPYRLDVAGSKTLNTWQRMEWRTTEDGK